MISDERIEALIKWFGMAKGGDSVHEYQDASKALQELLDLREQVQKLQSVKWYDEVQRLKEHNRLLIQDAERLADWLENVHIDYSNGNVAPNGMDEGDVLGWRGHKEIIAQHKELMERVK